MHGTLVSSFTPNLDIESFQPEKVIENDIYEELSLPRAGLIATTRTKGSLQTHMNTHHFFQEVENFRLSFDVLDVLEKYGKHVDVKGSNSIAANEKPVTEHSTWIGKHKFLPHIYHHVQQMEAVNLTLPAFPCKSLNRTNKVLGHLPDLGEELALRRLQALGDDIQKVYLPGAIINIASDGVLFNDILGISDQDCWDYGEALKAIIHDKGLTCLRFTRCMSLLGLVSEEEMDEEKYHTTTELCRRTLEKQFGSSEGALTKLIKNDKDSNMTYCGMVKFLQSEMETDPCLVDKANAAKIRVYKSVAKKMMQRAEAFTLAIRTLRPHHVRLSMHASSGAAKLSIALIPTPEGNFQKSPWHSCVAIGLDGAPRCVNSEEVRDTHDLVFYNGRPFFFQERFSENC